MRSEGVPAVAGRSRIAFGAALARAVRLSFRPQGRASRPEFWYFFVFGFWSERSKPGDNRYGPPPR